MKQILVILFLIPLSLKSLCGQTFIEDLSKIIEQGDASVFSQYFDKNINISFDNSQAIYSRSQAQIVLKDFFEAEPVKYYKVNFRSHTDNNEVLYLVSTLKTTKSEYLVYLAFKFQNKKYILTELQFKRQN